jgi:myosin heavy subunit|tara:strand:- start:19614 stop:20510 length:897 start_codon:yes stop_codon:yes gene_type:complete
MQNNEAEKVELELELPEGEVDIHAADVDDSIKDEAVEEPVVEQTQTKDELDEISDSVQKRIDKLTYKMREAERQRDEAVNYAQSVNHTATTLKEKLKNSDSSLFKEYDNRVQSEIERAKTALREAQDAGDGEAVANATEKLSRVSAEAENLRRLSAQQQLREKNEPQEVAVEPYQPTLQPQAVGPDPKAEEWAKQNTWFGDDQAMTFAAFGIHKELVEGGIDPTSDAYYTEVDKRMADTFPHKFSNEQSAPVQQVAASSRGAGGKKSSRKIKLTPSQVAIAKRLNVPLEEYAKHIEGV